MTFWRRPLPLLAICLLVFLCARNAESHAVLLETAPPSDSVVDHPPERVTLTFSEPISLIFVRLLDSNGAIVEAGKAARVIDHRVEIDLPAGVTGGAYILNWRVTSQDSHPVGGSFRFAVGNHPEAWRASYAPDVGTTRQWAWQLAAIVTRTVFLLSLLSGAGGILFLVVLGAGLSLREQRHCRRRVAKFAIIACTAGLSFIPIQGGLVLGNAPDSLADPNIWLTGATSRIGLSILLSVILMALTAAGLLTLASAGWLFIMMGISCAGVGALALGGHVATATPRWLTVPALCAHAGFAAFWYGSLWPLLRASSRLPAPDIAHLLMRFSRWATKGVFGLLVAGIGIAWVQVSSANALFTTNYGQLLLLKLSCVVVVLLLAIENKRRFTPALTLGSDRIRDKLKRNIRLELVGISLAILISVTLGHVTPPRALAISQTYHTHLPADDSAIVGEATDHAGRRAMVTVIPGRPGINVIRVRIFHPSGEVLHAIEARMDLSQPDAGIEPASRRLTAEGDALVFASTDLSLSGTWLLHIDALVSEFDKALFDMTVTIR